MSGLRAPRILVGTLLVVGGVKLAALVVPVLGPVVARSGQALAAGPATGAEAALPAPVLPVAVTDAALCESSDAIAAAIAEERELLMRQRAEIADRTAEATLAEESLRAERARLVELRDALESQITRVEEAYGQDLSKLVALYQNMKPEVAANIMDEMDIETATLVIAAMPERDAAQIVGQLSLGRARAISRIILERARLPGDQNLSGLDVN